MLRTCKYIKALGIHQFYNLPEYLMDKNIFMTKFDRINTAGLKKTDCMSKALAAEVDPTIKPEIDGVTFILSSGTSGNRGLQLTSKKEHLRWTGIVLAKLLPKPIFFKQKIALFLRSNSDVYETINSTQIQFQYYKLGEDIEDQLKKLEKYNPDIIVAPPSMLRIMAKELDEKRLVLSPLKVISCAEVLGLKDKKYLDYAFDQVIHEIYQCTEGFLGATCSHGNLHLNEEYLKIEKKWLDKSKRKFSPIITDTLRTTQPIIRYHLNDILTESADACPCGSRFTFIEQIEGRCDDIFYFSSDKGVTVSVFPDYIRRAVIKSSPNILEYKVIQQSLGKLEIQLKISDSNDFNSEVVLVKEELKKVLSSYGCQIPQFLFTYYIPNQTSVKLKRIISNINKENL